MASELAMRHIAAEKRLREAAAGATGRIWTALRSYDEVDVERWLSAAVPVVEAAKRQSIALTDAYLARVMERQPLGVDTDAIAARIRGGVTTDEVYRRPFVTTWAALGEGTQWAAAVKLGLDRVLSTAEMDVQLAMRETVSEVAQADDGIFGYERVPDGGACDLCLIASTQRYHTGDLMPIHNRCGCGVEPIVDESKLTESTGLGGPTVNNDLYQTLKGEGRIDAITKQRQLSRERVKAIEATKAEVVKHGELGPVLTNGDHDFQLL